MMKIYPSVTTILLFLSSHLLQCNATVVTAFPPDGLPESGIALEARATRNFDPRYRTWPNPQAIPYMFDTTTPYSTAERGIIMNAMAEISRQMGNCIRFTETTTANSGSGLFISKTFNQGSTQGAPTTCQTFPGQHYKALTRPQKMIMIPNTGNGNNGCLATQREAMKLLVNTLGLRDEWRRPGSSGTSCLQINGNKAGNIDQVILNSPGVGNSAAITGQYTTAASGNGAVDVMGSNFDYFSITIPAVDKFRPPNVTADTTTLWELPITPPADPVCQFPLGPTSLPITPIPAVLRMTNHISQDDCRGLKALYPTCSAVPCNDDINMVPNTAVNNAAFVTALPLPVAPAAGTFIGGTPTGTIIGGTPTGLTPGVVAPGAGVPLQFDANGNPILG